MGKVCTVTQFRLGEGARGGGDTIGGGGVGEPRTGIIYACMYVGTKIAAPTCGSLFLPLVSREWRNGVLHSSYRSLLMNPIDLFKGTLNIPYYYHSPIPD